MDVRQYGPAIFPSLKQTRRILDEETDAASESRYDASVSDSDASSRDSGSGSDASDR